MSDTDQTNITSQSGGVDVNAQHVDVSGDVVGRDEIESAGGHIIHAGPGAIVNIGERLVSAPQDVSSIIPDEPPSKHRYDRYRSWAMLGILISVALFSIAFLCEPIRSFIVIAFSDMPTPNATLTATSIPTVMATPTPPPTSTLRHPTATLRGAPLHVREAINLVEEANANLRRTLLYMGSDWQHLKRYWCGTQAWYKINTFLNNIKDDYGIRVSAIYTPTDAFASGIEESPFVDQTETWTYIGAGGQQKTEGRLVLYTLRKTGDEKQKYCIEKYLYSELLP